MTGESNSTTSSKSGGAQCTERGNLRARDYISEDALKQNAPNVESHYGEIDLVEIDKAIHPVTFTVTRGLKNMILISHYKGDISHSCWFTVAVDVTLPVRLHVGELLLLVVELEARAAVCGIVFQEYLVKSTSRERGDVRLTESGP
ncbi:hypothetical protein Pelo_19320 [Pelomyxa schiedti]|nr:hypothetical protein Pelo_19320 [Pelomyxa schiedti]